MKKLLQTISLGLLCYTSQAGGGSNVPGTHKLDSTFNTQQNVRTIRTASKDYDPRAVMQNEQGNLWLACRYT